MLARVRLRNARLRRRSSSGIDGLPAERAGRQVAERVREPGVDAHRVVDVAAGRRQPGMPARREVVHPPPVRDPGAGQADVAEHVAAGAREHEQQVQAAVGAGEAPVPVVGLADHAVTQPEGGDRELDRHRGDVRSARHPARRARARAANVVDRRGPAHPRQVVVADQPLVVEGDALPGSPEPLSVGQGRRAPCPRRRCGSGPSPGGSGRPRGSRRCAGPASARGAWPSARPLARPQQVVTRLGLVRRRPRSSCPSSGGARRPRRTSPTLARPARRRTTSRGRAAASGPAADRWARRPRRASSRCGPSSGRGR